MIVTLVLSTADTSTFQSLVVRQGGQDTEDDWDSSVEGDAHEGMRDALANVLEVHSRALDEDTNSDDSIHGLTGHGGDRSG